jgi:hypothetical protein
MIWRGIQRLKQILVEYTEAPEEALELIRFFLPVYLRIVSPTRPKHARRRRWGAYKKGCEATLLSARGHCLQESAWPRSVASIALGRKAGLSPARVAVWTAKFNLGVCVGRAARRPTLPGGVRGRVRAARRPTLPGGVRGRVRAARRPALSGGVRCA